MNQAISFCLLGIPPLLASTLLFPALTAPIRLPLYFLSIIFFGLLLRKFERFYFYPLTLVVFIWGATIAHLLVTDSYDAGVGVRQAILYSTLFALSAVGYYLVRSATSAEKVISLLLNLHLVFFCYGIYTFLAQKFQWDEYLYFLRPSPVLLDSGPEYLKNFSGWASPYRAYSVWFEPSFSSIVLAGVLPLLMLRNSNRYRFFFLAILGVYAYLTFSRSVWVVYLIFIVFLLIPKRLPYLLSVIPGLMYISIAAIVLAQLFVTLLYADASASIREQTLLQAIYESFEKPVLGTGHAELLEAAAGSHHIHNSFIGLFHWYGLIGLTILLLPIAALLQVSIAERHVGFVFSFLVSLAFVVGGALHSLSIYWFWFGVYYGLFERMGRNRANRLSASA